MIEQIPESPVKVKHDVAVSIKKIYPHELKECVPILDSEWSWTHLKTILVKFHKQYGGKVEIERIY